MKRTGAWVLILLVVVLGSIRAQQQAGEPREKGSRELDWTQDDWAREHAWERSPEAKAKLLAERPELTRVWPGNFSKFTSPVPSGKKYPTTFPRPGSTKLFENDTIILWDEVMSTGGGSGQMHKHVRDQTAIPMQGGWVKYTEVDGRYWFQHTNPSGRPSLPSPNGLGLTLAGNGPHAEINPDVTRGVRHWLWVEHKGTEPKDCRNWSTDPVCNGQPWPAPATYAQARLRNFPVPAGKQYPSAFPHAGATRMFESDKIRIWDELLPTKAGEMHKHVRDSIAIQMNSGLVKETLVDGKSSTAQSGPEDSHYPRVEFMAAGSGPHAEMSADLNENQRHWVWIEFKGTEPKDCKTWSTDPACK